MARDFTIYNNDVREKQVTTNIIIAEITYIPLLNNYMPNNSGFTPLITTSEYLKEQVYGPLSYQIAGPISLRNVTQSYQLSIGGND